MEEVWKDVPGFGDCYQASNMGNVRVKDRAVKKYSWMSNSIIEQKYKGRLLNPCVSDKYGHLSVHIGFEKKKWNVGVHRLVLLAFISDCPDDMEACHNNGIASDNRIENLRWDTHDNNNKDRKKHGTYKRGKDHPMYGKKMPLDLKEKLLKFHTGRKASEETKLKMSLAQKERWKNVQKQKTA